MRPALPERTDRADEQHRCTNQPDHRDHHVLLHHVLPVIHIPNSTPAIVINGCSIRATVEVLLTMDAMLLTSSCLSNFRFSSYRSRKISRMASRVKMLSVAETSRTMSEV